MQTGLSARRPKRWPWIVGSAVIALVACVAMIALAHAAGKARHGEATAREFATRIDQTSLTLAPLAFRLSKTDPALLRETIEVGARLAERQLGDLREVAPKQAAEIERLLGQVVAATRPEDASTGELSGAIVAAARISNLATAVADQQHKQAERANTLSLIGRLLIISLTVVLVAMVFGWERRRFVRIERQHAADLADVAERDALTGLPTRLRFSMDLNLREAAGEPTEVAICDLNGFKEINHRLGHDAGDAVLITVARDLQSAVRDDAVVYRTGGDQFALISAPGARTAERIRDALERDREQSLGSVGVAQWPADHENIRDVVRLADQRMYAVKRVLGVHAPAGLAEHLDADAA